MQKKPFLNPLVFTVLVFTAVFVLLGAAIAGAKPKPAPKIQTARVRTGAVYTPASLATDDASVPSDGSTTPELTSGIGSGDATLRRLPGLPLHYKLLSLKKRPVGATTTPPPATFHLQVYEVTFEAGSHKLRLKAETNASPVRIAWKYLDANGTATKWPKDGIPISVSGTGDIKTKIKYVGGTLGAHKNYLFVLSSDTPTIEDLFASTVIHVEE